MKTSVHLPAVAPGRVGFLNGPSRLARIGGTLIAELAGDRIAVWLRNDDQDRAALMLPGEYTARLDPFELIDEHGEVIARDGQRIAAVGGFLSCRRPASCGVPARGVLRKPTARLTAVPSMRGMKQELSLAACCDGDPVSPATIGR